MTDTTTRGLGPKRGGRHGDWACGFTGRPFWPLDPRPEDVHLEDIAHALACINRYGGHARQPISVARHSLLVLEHLAAGSARDIGGTLRLAALLHDAHEAYLGDMVRPLKLQPEMEYFRWIARQWDSAIAIRFGFSMDLFDHPVIRRADASVLALEAHALMPKDSVKDWNLPIPPARWQVLVLKTWEEDRADFLAAFRHIDRRIRRELESQGWRQGLDAARDEAPATGEGPAQ